MNPDDIGILSNADIPESIRAKIAEQIVGAGDREAQRALEAKRLAAERTKFLWNTPVVAAIAGLLTLTATFVFERLTAKDETVNTITLEQVRTELEQSEARLKQELELAASENLARLEAEAKEREFQYEIVRSELTNAEKSNAERAAVLLFLVRAGVLSTLNEDELREMAEQQIERPDATIIPQLTPSPQNLGGIVGFDDSGLVSGFDIDHPARQLARSVGRLKIMNANQAVSMCTAFLVSKDQIATARHCVDQEYQRMRFELFPDGFDATISGGEFETYEVSNTPATIYRGDGRGGYAVLTLEQPVGDAFQPLATDPSTGAEGARLGVIYFRFGSEQRAVWGAPDCKVLKWENDLFYHLCDTGAGTSGSPIIDLETNAVVAVHTRRSEFGGVAYRVVD
ncbi:trypsin-like peptidase domain-containing protein [uncultured Roseobacter sp.]|uniref:trypsin-like serine peptidase n=1 Tax=uncultured Roseobacter sp. TaxID=114847 RepID=UPI00262A3146|nr:trypsin-like peptidase domain-containing protein [uncultured Roseobacter sp.]